MRVAIIGAGAAGLAAAKALCEVGLSPIVFEETDSAGGLWVYREHGLGAAYRSLRTNTSKQITAYSDLPFPVEAPDFPPRAEVEAYLRHYAESFDLVRLIRFGERVDSLCQKAGGGWLLKAARGLDECFDAVAVCTGIFRKPSVPTIPGLSSFSGSTSHSLEYRRPEPFAGRDVLVMGLGSSAVDIAADLAGIASGVTLSVRRGAWVAPRFVAGRPFDHYATRLAALLPAGVRSRRRERLLLGEYSRRGVDPPPLVWARSGIPFAPRTAPSVGSDALLPRIMAGEIEVCPAIESVSSREVIFANGRRLYPDAIIFCTGYVLDFPFLSADLRPWTAASTGLYRLVFPPDDPTLAFIGVCRVHGPILPIVEMQARWAARVLAGTVRLPPAVEMRAEIHRRWQRQTAAGESVLRVALVPYLDEIGAEVGTRPRLWRHPFLLGPLLTGPPVAAQYRLDGPDRWEGAEYALRDAVTL